MTPRLLTWESKWLWWLFAKTGYAGVAAGGQGKWDVSSFGTGEFEAAMECPREGGPGGCLGIRVWGSI